MPKTAVVLFLCTGNYYRSRLAEELFNHLATEAHLSWCADSAALALELGHDNIGVISPYTLDGLKACSIVPRNAARPPRPVTIDDFVHADRIIALKEEEHRPYIQKQFPAHADKVTYWHINDVPPSDTYSPFVAIRGHVEELIARLSATPLP